MLAITTGCITDPDKQVQGSALYVEMKHNNSDGYYQFFITPDGFDENNNLVFAQIFKRRLTADEQKKQWRIARLVKQLLPSEEVTTADLEKHRANRFSPLSATLTRLNHDYTMVGKPFFVEVSKKDLTDISAGKTPIKVVYRIGQTRKALGFPEMFEVK